MGSDKVLLRYDFTDHWFCRVHYKSPNGYLYCIQQEMEDVFVCYVCSGPFEGHVEPSHEVKDITYYEFELAQGGFEIDNQVNNFLLENNLQISAK